LGVKVFEEEGGGEGANKVKEVGGMWFWILPFVVVVLVVWVVWVVWRPTW